MVLLRSALDHSCALLAALVGPVVKGIAVSGPSARRVRGIFEHPKKQAGNLA